MVRKIASMAVEIGVTGFGDEAALVEAIHNIEERIDSSKGGKGVNDKNQ